MLVLMAVLAGRRGDLVPFLADSTYKAQLDIGRTPWAPNHIKCSAARRIHVEFPFSVSRKHDNRWRVLPGSFNSKRSA